MRILVLAAATQLGCALVVSGVHTTQRVAIETDPPGAAAASGSARCTTPCALELPRRRDAVVSLSKEGFEPATLRFRSRQQAATIANVLLGPAAPAGFALDYASGAAFELVPREVVAPLRPAHDPAPTVAHDPAPAVQAAPAALAAGAPAAEVAPSPSPAGERVLSPPPPLRASLRVLVGGADVAGLDGVFRLGVLGTWRPAGPWTIGAALESGESWSLSGGPPDSDRLLSLLAGVEAVGRVGKLSALLQGGSHQLWLGAGPSATSAFYGARLEAQLVGGDALSFGLWGAWGEDVSTRAVTFAGAGTDRRIGGTTFGLGLSLGLVGR